jgi:hypothetical protein
VTCLLRKLILEREPDERVSIARRLKAVVIFRRSFEKKWRDMEENKNWKRILMTS